EQQSEHQVPRPGSGHASSLSWVARAVSHALPRLRYPRRVPGFPRPKREGARMPNLRTAARAAAALALLAGVFTVSGAAPPRRAGKLFGLKVQPPRQQPFLVQIGSPFDARTARPIVDPNVINPAGTTAIDFFVPSLNGRKVAVSLSEKGSEDGTVHVYDVTT